MVSTMTFDQLADTYELFLRKTAPGSASDARQAMADFLEDAGGEEAVLERRVRIGPAHLGVASRVAGEGLDL